MAWAVIRTTQAMLKFNSGAGVAKVSTNGLVYPSQTDNVCEVKSLANMDKKFQVNINNIKSSAHCAK